jgi:vacuolar protein sorting-associated protein 13A/C
MTFLNALGIALTNIDDAPINLNGIQLSNFFDTIDGIVTKLGLHYKEALLNSLLQVIGSIDILGNPFGLMKHLAVGVFDLIDKPIEGFVKGPLEGGFGIARGAGSFLKNTVAGTFNSVQKITGSFATGISSLSLDDEYLAQREKIKMTKPKHALDGLKQGAMSIFSGLEKGLTGIVTQPYEGYKKGGFGGILKGSIQGLAGLVVKPVAGIFDATSKTAEGIKNTATHFDEKPSDKRQRFLRVFYNKEKYFKSYSKRDSEIMAFLANYKKDKLHNLSLIENLELRFMENGVEFGQYLIFTLEMVLLFEFPKLLFDLKVTNIREIGNCEEGIKVKVFETSKKMKKKEQLIKVEKGKDREYIFEMLTELMEYAKEKPQV